jgi:hypothetical protein
LIKILSAYAAAHVRAEAEIKQFFLTCIDGAYTFLNEAPTSGDLMFHRATVRYHLSVMVHTAIADVFDFDHAAAALENVDDALASLTRAMKELQLDEATMVA